MNDPNREERGQTPIRAGSDPQSERGQTPVRAGQTGRICDSRSCCHFHGEDYNLMMLSGLRGRVKNGDPKVGVFDNRHRIGGKRFQTVRRWIDEAQRPPLGVDLDMAHRHFHLRGVRLQDEAADAVRPRIDDEPGELTELATVIGSHAEVAQLQ